MLRSTERTVLRRDFPCRSYKVVANQTARAGYRADLRSHAVERVSAIRRTQGTPKADYEVKLRGNKAKKAAESA